jgi:hypothetical protein
MSETAEGRRSNGPIIGIAVLVIVCLGICSGLLWLGFGRPPLYNSVSRIMLNSRLSQPERLNDPTAQQIIDWVTSPAAIGELWTRLTPATQKELSNADALSRWLKIAEIKPTTVVQIEFANNSASAAQNVVQTTEALIIERFPNGTTVIAPASQAARIR